MEGQSEKVLDLLIDPKIKALFTKKINQEPLNEEETKQLFAWQTYEEDLRPEQTSFEVLQKDFLHQVDRLKREKVKAERLEAARNLKF